MIDFQGKQRIVITNVDPELNCGKNAIKRVLGERVTVSADVFGDGHDIVKAALHYRRKNDKDWKEVPMTFLGNDRWEAYFIPEKTGQYEYVIRGWVDHFGTWQHALKKKFEDN